MFDIDVFNNLERLSIYLAKPSSELLWCLDDIIDDDSATLSIGLNQRYTLSFDVNLASEEDNLWYEYIQEGMYLFVPKVGLFKMNQPTASMDDSKDVKTITAYSCDSELDDKTVSLSLNMGTETSMEYLVEYDDDETESLLNPYTGIPYDWLVLYNTFPEQLTIEKQKYNQSYYGSLDSSGEIVVTDETLISELQTLFTLIPRLKRKIITTTDENGINDYSLVEYAIYEYGDGEDDVISITLTSLYEGRLDELVTFYTKYREQLSLLCVVLDKTDGNWTVGDIYGVSDGDYSLANKKYQFEVDENIYSFLTNTLSQTINCIIDFDIVNRKVNVTPVDVIGNDTGIVLTYDNLMNTMDISCNEDILCTRLYVTGADDLTIEQVNFGLAYIDDIDYKINVRDSNGNRIYVSDDLAEKYTEYVEYRESLRDEYIQCSKDYNSYDSEISEIKYRVPNDSVQIDWSTYSVEELETALTTYKNLLAALQSLYKNDYGTSGLNSDGSINEAYIQQTMYWYDYVAYQTTISQIECAITVYPYYDDESNWSAAEIAQYKEAISAWETEWTLYGTVELQAKISTYEQNMELLVDAGSVILDSNGIAIPWDDLTEDQQTDYSSLSTNYYYDTYIGYYNNMVAAQEYLDTLLAQIAELEALQETAQTRRTAIVKSVTMTNYFTEDECKILNRLFKESNYSNENILVTSLNNTVDSLDVMYELLEDGKEQASILSRPQLQFSIDADNLLGIPDFEPLWNDFKPGNYMMIQYRDDTYVKLRMTGYTFNPCLPSNNSLSLTFSNYIRSKTGLSDIESMLGLATSSGSSSGGSGSGSGGTYGESDDIDVTISNTMLAKLLNSETFGTRVTNVILDTIDANAITARYATFNGLAKGTTIVDGKCITTGYIVDFTYDGTDGDIDNTTGSVINLETGQFSFAGGRLVWDGSILKITGDGTGIDISMNETISGLSTNITANAEGITSVVKSVTDLSNNLSTNYSTTTTVESMISQTAGEITTSVTKLSETLSENYSTTTQVQSMIQEEADEITLSVTTLEETITENYSTTTQVESMIKESADSITLSVTSLEENLTENYSTTTQVESMIKESADSITSSISSLTEGLSLDDYSTTTQVQSMIQESADSITLSITSLEENLSENYSTTTQTQSMIDETADSITSTVSSNITASTTKYGTCGTAAATKSKVVVCEDFSLRTGAVVCVYFTYANTSTTPTLNVNSTGAYSIYAYGATIAASSPYNWVAKSYVTFIFDGSHWCMVDSASNSKIEQLADSISLSVTGALGSTASIVLSANGSSTTGSIDMSGVRSAFADDTTAITISAGTVTFESNTFIVDSTYFSVSKYGFITSTSGKIGGGTIGSNSIYRSGADSDGNTRICYLSGSGSSTDNFLAVTDSDGSAYFTVYQDGTMYCQECFAQYQVNVAGDVRMWTDDEGGNIVVRAPSDYEMEYQVDAYNGSLRVFGNSDDGTVNPSGSKFVAFDTVQLTLNGCLPVSDKGAVLGYSSYRWSAVYSATSTIQTSDENEKTDIVDISEQYEQLFMKLRGVNFMWKTYDPNDTHVHDRIHCGLIAQEVEAACVEVGLSSLTFAALCKDTLDEATYDGRTERYGLAYSELHGLEVHMIQKNVYAIEQLSSDVLSVEARLTIAEGEIATLQNELTEARETIKSLTEQLQASA